MTEQTAAFTPITGWDMMERLGVGYTFANTTEARAWPWEESKHIGWDTESAWGQPLIEQWHFQSIAVKGFDSYRMCVSWTPHMDDNYIIDKAWLDRIQQLVDWALDAGLKVILNTHHEEEIYQAIRDNNYAEAKTRLTAIWSQVAERFRDYPETLVFETMNEANFLEHYGSDKGSWLGANAYEQNLLIDSVNKLNKDALDIIRKSGGYNDKRVVMLSVPGAQAWTIPFMNIPDDDLYIMLGAFGYQGAFINDENIKIIQSLLDKDIGFVNKEDKPGGIHRDESEDLLKYTERHFGELAAMGIPSFWFGGCASKEDETHSFLNRVTGEWVYQSYLEALFAAYGR
ncbi:MAG: glycoside hydrolase family 5 protein [Oscillospiraceae bacterium]|nr:glycoside hydrolase family 5 protein [Oscillospiraceae bacterium]